MATPTWQELQTIVYNRILANVLTDNPVGDTLFNDAINEACFDVWQMSGGRLKSVGSARAWDKAQLTANGSIFGLLTDVDEIIHLYATIVAPTTINCATTTAVTAVGSLAAAALFGSVVPGMEMYHATAFPNYALVSSVTDTSNLTASQPAVVATTPQIVFTPTSGAIELEPVPLSEIRQRRINAGGVQYGGAPKLYATVRMDNNSVIANNNRLRLELWPTPTVSTYYYPMEYAAQWLVIDSSTNTIPALDDVWARDAALLCASRLAQVMGRGKLVPGIVADYSDRMKAAMERRLSSGVDAKAS